MDAGANNIRWISAKVVVDDPVTGRQIWLKDRQEQAMIAADGSIRPMPYQHFATENYEIQPRDIVAVAVAMFRRY